MILFSKKQLLSYGIDFLQGVCKNNKMEAAWLLGYALGSDHHSSLNFMVMDDFVLDVVSNRYIDLLKRRKMGYSLPTLCQSQYFMDMTFFVDANVLVPRQDTEILVASVQERYDASDSLSILEIGTGSGVIAVALAKFFKNSYVYATDLCQSSLNIAYVNSIYHHISNILFFHGYCFDAVQSHYGKNYFDIIISNPPYIDVATDATIQDLQLEPTIALDGGVCGTDILLEIISKSNMFLKRMGRIFLEIDSFQVDFLTSVLRRFGYSQITSFFDHGHMTRFLTGILL